MSKFSVELIKNFTGFVYLTKEGLCFAKINDPDPYFRGLLCEVTSSVAKVEFTQPGGREHY